MKKIIMTLVCLMACIAVLADTNYFTMGVNDTVYINPYTMVNGDSLAVKACFNGRLDRWDVTFSYPDGMEARRVNARADMSIPYLDQDSVEQILDVELNTNYHHTVFSAQIWQFGYYYIGGMMLPYGTVKWEAGFHGRMFDIGFWFDQDFTGGTVSISGTLSTEFDYRGGLIDIPFTFTRSVEVIVGYMRGDVNGDGSLTIDDVTALISYLLNPDGSGWDQYQVAAADVDGNGSIGINDVTALTNLLIHSGTNNIEELLDILSSFNQMMYSRGQGVYSAPAGIDELTGMTRHVVDDNYYNLMGQPVGKDLPSTPGIYIHQGKKICVSRMP